MTEPVCSFAAGPSMLPRSVLDRVRADMHEFAGSGLSVLEAPVVEAPMIETWELARDRVRQLLDVPDDMHVLFMHAGASTQFALVPLHMDPRRRGAAYVHTGLWSGKAIAEARKYVEVDVVGDAGESRFRSLPSVELRPDRSYAYLHYTSCESVQGLQFRQPPLDGGPRLVCDATASLFAQPIDLRLHDVVYASAQKNLGALGLTLVLVRDSVLGHSSPMTPTALDWDVQRRNASRYTTPPGLAWYVAGLMLEWMIAEGGAGVIAEGVRRRASALHAVLDSSDFWTTPNDKASRSSVSIPFATADPTLTETFLDAAQGDGLVGLRGHSSVGGMRACLFVGTPDLAVARLVDFMRAFEGRFG